MADPIDRKTLSVREGEQVEWNENVADTDDVAETLSAKEEKDENGFPRIAITGLTASPLKEVEGKVLTACGESVLQSIAPLVEELTKEFPDRRVLIFIMPSTRSAHLFRRRREARNGILRELLTKGCCGRVRQKTLYYGNCQRHRFVSFTRCASPNKRLSS